MAASSKARKRLVLEIIVVIQTKADGYVEVLSYSFLYGSEQSGNDGDGGY